MSTKNLVLIVIIIVLGALVATQWHQITRIKAVPNQTGSSSETFKEEPLSGYIVFVDDDSVTRRAVPHAYSLVTGEIEELQNNDATYYAFPVRTPDMTLLGYAEAPYVGESPWHYPYTEFVTIPYFKFDATLERFSTDVGAVRHVSVSPSREHVIFVGLNPEMNKQLGDNIKPIPYEAINSYSIYLYSVSTEELKEVIGGISPVWNNEGSGFWFLKEGGIGYYELESSLFNEIIYNPVWTLTSLDSLAISEDGRFAYVSDLLAGGLFKYKIGEAMNFIYEDYSTNYVEIPDRRFPYTLFPVGTKGDVGFTTYQGGEVTVWVYSDGSSTPKSMFTVAIDRPFNIAPQWVSELPSQ